MWALIFWIKKKENARFAARSNGVTAVFVSTVGRLLKVSEKQIVFCP